MSICLSIQDIMGSFRRFKTGRGWNCQRTKNWLITLGFDIIPIVRTLLGFPGFSMRVPLTRECQTI